jgi:hypothetical protein
MAGTITHLSDLHLRDCDTMLPGLFYSGQQQMTYAANTALSIVEGSDLVAIRKLVTLGGIANNTATTVFTITLPNVTCSAVFRLLGMAWFDVAPIKDSTRVWEYQVVITRRAGVAAVAAISAAIGGTIATLAAGATLTSTPTLGSVTGGATATETVAVQITNVASAGTPTSSTQILIDYIGSCPGTAAGGGITISN